MEEAKKTERLDRFIEGIFGIFYSKDKTKLYITLLVIAGFILRLIAANNSGLGADDAGHAIRAIGAIESGKLEEYGQSSILWYYIQEVFMKVFGESQIGSRIASAIFGSFFIILIFLFLKQVLKANKPALIASTLAAFSPWFVKMTLPEMDVTATFFILFSALFLFKFVESFKTHDLMLASVLIGLAVMIKVYSLFFAFSYFIFILIFCKKHKDLKFAFKKVFLFCIIVLIFCIPTITNNYLLYKDKGFVDYMTTNFLKIGIEKSAQYYSWAPGYNTPTDYAGFFFGKQKTYTGNGESFEGSSLPGFIVMLQAFLINEPLIILFGFLGLFLLMAAKKEKNLVLFFFLCATIPFIFLGAHINMLKHQTYMPVLLLSFAGFFISFLDDKIKSKIPRFKLRYILIAIIIFNLLWLGRSNSIYQESIDTKLINEKLQSIDENAFVIADARIFRGTAAWLFHDRNFIESSLFSQAIEESQKYEAAASMDVYLVECVVDDCGWGTIKDQPDFNKTVEEMITWFANKSKVVAEISGPDYSSGYYFPLISKPINVMRYKIYKTTITLPAAIIPLAKSTHNFLLYPIGYDRTFGPLFDDYETHGLFDTNLNKFARYLLYFGIALSILSLFFLTYIFVIEKSYSDKNEI